MATVTGIREDKQVVQVSLDGTVAFFLRASDFQKFPLRPDDECDMEAYLARFAQSQFKPCLDAALTILDRAPKTEKAMEALLRRKGFVELSIARVVERLKELRLLDDAELARRMVELRGSGETGKYRLRRKLLEKGVTQEDADDALEAVSDADQLAGATALARKLLDRYSGEEPRKQRAKLSQALARRGFGWDVIASAVDAVLTTQDWD